MSLPTERQPELRTEPESAFDLHATIDGRAIGVAQLTVLALCFLLNAIDGFDVLAIAFAAPALASDWDLPASDLGLVFSAGVLGMTLGAMFLAPLSDRVGRRTMVLSAVSVMGLSMLATAWAADLWTMIGLRLITGLTIGAMLASLTSQVSEFFPDRARNMAVGVMLSGYPLGATLGGFFTAVLIPDYGWQGVFVAGGVMTLGILPLLWLWLPESPHFLLRRRPRAALHRLNRVLSRLQIDELGQLPQLRANDEPAAAAVSSLLAPSYRRQTLKLWAAFFVCFGTLYFLLSWIPKLLVDSGLPLEQAIYAGIAFNIGGAAGNILVAWASVRMGLQRAIMVFNAIAAAGMVLFASTSLSITALLVLTALIGLFQQGGFVGFYMVAARLYPAEIRTTGVGWGIGLGRFGAVIAPWSAGVLITLGWSMSALFLLFAVPLVVGGLVIYSMRLNTAPR